MTVHDAWRIKRAFKKHTYPTSAYEIRGFGSRRVRLWMKKITRDRTKQDK